MSQLQPRREVWEFGTLPVSVLCPSLDASSLVLAHSKLLSRSLATDGGESKCCALLRQHACASVRDKLLIFSRIATAFPAIHPNSSGQFNAACTDLSFPCIAGLVGTVDVSDVARLLELTSNQSDVLLEVLSALSLCPPPPPGPHGSRVVLHELSMFLVAQLFSREAQRPDSTEYWPEAGPGSSPSSSMELLSPTRQLFRSQSGGVCTLQCTL